MRLQGKTALVTAAGQGIGRASALARPIPCPAAVTSAVLPCSLMR